MIMYFQSKNKTAVILNRNSVISAISSEFTKRNFNSLNEALDFMKSLGFTAIKKFE